MRLDKILANRAFGSRKEVHEIIKKGLVQVNGKVICQKDYAVDIKVDTLMVGGEEVQLIEKYYVKLHKPKGYVTAVEDPHYPTVMDLLPLSYKKMGVYPVGRLDKDTEGLLLLTNDGLWAHRIINGKKEVCKCYFAEYAGQLTDDADEKVRAGLILEDGTQCRPAILKMLGENNLELTLKEGKFHQVKRMVSILGGEVTYLKRLSVGSITLKGIEEAGSYTFLDDEEVQEV